MAGKEVGHYIKILYIADIGCMLYSIHFSTGGFLDILSIFGLTCIASCNLSCNLCHNLRCSQNLKDIFSFKFSSPDFVFFPGSNVSVASYCSVGYFLIVVFPLTFPFVCIV